jgi:DNA polymerase III gamma/tau subunit
MTYQVLANKWRPKDFTEVVSQVSAVTILENSLDSQNVFPLKFSLLPCDL